MAGREAFGARPRPGAVVAIAPVGLEPAEARPSEALYTPAENSSVALTCRSAAEIRRCLSRDAVAG